MNGLAVGAGALALVWLVSRRKRAPATDAALPIVEPDRPLPPVPTPDPPHVEHLSDIIELLGEFVSDDPKPGNFYQVREGDTPMDVVREALGGPGQSTEQGRISYLHCIASGPAHNMRLYGTGSTSLPYPKEFLVPGKKTGVRVAFLPRNADAHALMLQGMSPEKTVKANGAATGAGESLGLLWLPPVDLSSGEPTCAPFSWDDGSSTIDPPPQLLALLEKSN